MFLFHDAHIINGGPVLRFLVPHLLVLLANGSTGEVFLVDHNVALAEGEKT